MSSVAGFKGTPGPWVFVPSNPTQYQYRESELDLGGFKAGDNWVCRFGDSSTYYPSEGEPPSEADARLIASAPDLLEAVQRLIGSLGVMIMDPDNDGDIQFGRAAISKALGESQ